MHAEMHDCVAVQCVSDSVLSLDRKLWGSDADDDSVVVVASTVLYMRHVSDITPPDEYYSARDAISEALSRILRYLD